MEDHGKQKCPFELFIYSYLFHWEVKPLLSALAVVCPWQSVTCDVNAHRSRQRCLPLAPTCNKSAVTLATVRRDLFRLWVYSRASLVSHPADQRHLMSAGSNAGALDDTLWVLHMLIAPYWSGDCFNDLSTNTWRAVLHRREQLSTNEIYIISCTKRMFIQLTSSDPLAMKTVNRDSISPIVPSSIA